MSELCICGHPESEHDGGWTCGAGGCDNCASFWAEPPIIHIVFDGPPGHESGRFVEVETVDGRSFNAGEWVEMVDGYWALRIEPMSLAGRVREMRRA